MLPWLLFRLALDRARLWPAAMVPLVLLTSPLALTLAFTLALMRPWLLSSWPAAMVVLPLLWMVPKRLFKLALALMLALPWPSWVMLPALLSRVWALMLTCWATLVALVWSMLAALRAKAPLLVIWPRWPARLVALMFKLPVPACSILPSVLVSVCAARLRLALFDAISPCVLSSNPTRLSARSVCPICTIFPLMLLSEFALSAI